MVDPSPLNDVGSLLGKQLLTLIALFFSQFLLLSFTVLMLMMDDHPFIYSTLYQHILRMPCTPFIYYYYYYLYINQSVRFRGNFEGIFVNWAMDE